VDWFSFPRSVLTLRFRSELGELGLDFRAAIMAIRVTDTAITRMDTLDHIRTMVVIMGDRHTTGPADTGFITATIVIITTAMDTKLA
jgi:hypothetical protein